MFAGFVLLGCLAVLAVAVYVDPEGPPSQLGGPCGMLVTTGLPCPTCGMTTAFAYTVRGRWLRAAWAQPAGFVFALGTIGLAVVAVGVLIRGRWPRIGVGLIRPDRLFLGLLVLLLGAWAFKICAGLLDGTLPYR